MNYTKLSIQLDMKHAFYNFLKAFKCSKSGDLPGAHFYANAAVGAIHSAGLTQARASQSANLSGINWETLAKNALLEAKKEIRKDQDIY